MLKDKLLTCAVISAICVVDCTVSMRGDGQYALLESDQSEEFKAAKKKAKEYYWDGPFTRKWWNRDDCFKVGDMYYRNDGCGDKYPTDAERKKVALKWFKRSQNTYGYELGKLSLLYLHHMYSNGIGTAANRKKAAKYADKIRYAFRNFAEDFRLDLFEMAVCAGHKAALTQRGIRSMYGKYGVEQNYSDALKYLELAAKNSQSSHKGEAEYCIAYMYSNGLGTTRNQIKAREYLKKCQNADDFEYWAPESLKIAADYENPEAAYWFGKISKDRTEKIKYYKMATDNGYGGTKANAAYELGKLYETGYETRKYYKIAADEGHTEAAFKLGEYYKTGTTAIKYYKIAADNGADDTKTNAAYELGKLYGTGSDAIKYYRIAANKGHSGAKSALKEIQRIELAAKRKQEELARRKREHEEKLRIAREKQRELEDLKDLYLSPTIEKCKKLRSVCDDVALIETALEWKECAYGTNLHARILAEEINRYRYRNKFYGKINLFAAHISKRRESYIDKDMREKYGDPDYIDSIYAKEAVEAGEELGYIMMARYYLNVSENNFGEYLQYLPEQANEYLSKIKLTDPYVRNAVFKHTPSDKIKKNNGELSIETKYIIHRDVIRDALESMYNDIMQKYRAIGASL